MKFEAEVCSILLSICRLVLHETECLRVYFESRRGTDSRRRNYVQLELPRLQLLQLGTCETSTWLKFSLASRISRFRMHLVLQLFLPAEKNKGREAWKGVAEIKLYDIGWNVVGLSKCFLPDFLFRIIEKKNSITLKVIIIYIFVLCLKRNVI